MSERVKHKYLYAQWSSTGWGEANVHFDTLDEYIEQARQRSEDKWGTYAVFEQDKFYEDWREDYEQPLVICYHGIVYMQATEPDDANGGA